MKNWRINLVLVFILIFGAAIISRLFYLQIIKRGFYQAQALGQQVRLREVEGLRGEIFFKNKTKSLAINKERWVVYVLPEEIEDKTLTAEILSKTLDKPQDLILSKIEEGDYYTAIKNRLTEEEVEKIESLNLEGVYWEEFPGRYYPQETLASHTIGFLGGDEKGQYGLEGYYDEILRGKEGFKEERKGFILLDSLFGPENLEPVEDGSDLYLTIDYNIQFKAESLLEEAKELFDIEAGQIIVLEPDSGEVLALADFPNFNPNQYSKEKDLSIFQNGAVQKIFEPGSVLKPITMAIALNEGKITPSTTYQDEGYVKVGVETIYNYGRRVYGEKSMTEVLEKSINTGAVFVSKLIPREVFLEYIDKFGFNKQTDIDLQGEIYSQNENLKKGQEINFATASFGQGIEMTPIQLIRAFCVIANGGKLVKPYLVEKIVNTSTSEIQPQVLGEVINQQAAFQLTAMLISVVENGFAKAAKIPGYYIAGKTGTAQVAYEEKGGYYPDKSIQSFIGFGPALNPQFLILVKLDNPKTKTAEYSAVPIFKKLAKHIIDYWQIPPDYQ